MNTELGTENLGSSSGFIPKWTLVRSQSFKISFLINKIGGAWGRGGEFTYIMAKLCESNERVNVKVLFFF